MSCPLLKQRAEDLYRERWHSLLVQTDRSFAVLLLVEWLCAIAISLARPSGAAGSWSEHLKVALVFGGLAVLPPVALAALQPGRLSTRCTIAVGQMLFSALLVHLTGGRIETHFHIFGSLAFLAFYRDWRVFVPATLTVIIDHALRGYLYPMSVYGVDHASLWRTFEHGGWVVFEVALLIVGCQRSQAEMSATALNLARLEATNASVEDAIVARTAELAESRCLAQSRVADLSTVMIAARMGLWNFDRRRGRMVWSEESYRIFRHLRGEEVTLEMLRRRVHPDDLERLEQVWQATTESRPFSEELRLLVEEEPTLWVWVQSPGAGPAGSHITLGTVQDISERKHAEEQRHALETQLRQVQKMEAVGLLAGGVAHDFNNVLMVIDGFAELLPFDETEEQRAESIAEIRKAVQRSSGLVKQLLTFARKDQVRPEILELESAVTETVKMLQVLIGENIDLEWRPEGSLPCIQADRAQLSQILTNLTINARDAIRARAGQPYEAGHIGGTGRVVVETGLVTVGSSPSPGAPTPEHLSSPGGPAPGLYVRLSVSDNGCGMSPEVMERAFDPFFTTKGRGCGTGLGLSTVYGIVQQNGGATTITSQVGCGTTVTVLLPVSEEVAEPTYDSTTLECATGNETILVVEDEEALLDLTGRFLRRAGYHVLTAGRPSEALEVSRLYDGRIDLLLTDVIMPEMDGSLLAQHLQGARPDLTTLFMSGYTASVVLDRQCEYLAKPFGFPELSRKVRQALARQKKGA